MHVCFFNSELHWGGGEKWHYKMAQLFHKEGHDTVICANPGSELEEKAAAAGIPVKRISMGKMTFINPVKIKKISSFFKSNGIDTVIMNNPADLKTGTIAAKLAGVKNIIYRRGMPHPIRNTAFNRWLFKNLTAVIAISEEVKRSILVNNPDMITNDKIHLMYNAVDSADYCVEERENPAKIVFGNTGRLVEQKGQHHLVEAAEILRNSGLDFKIKIAGKGPLEKNLKELISVKGLENYIEMTGFITDLDPFLNSVDVFVFPSYFEGSAVSVVEAIYFGKPIITFDVSTLPELVKDGYNGFLVKFKDSVDLAEKMQYFIKNRSAVKEMGGNSLKEAAKYDLYEVFKRLKKIIS